MKVLMLLAFVCFAGVKSDCETPYKVLFNAIVSKQVIMTENQFRLYNKTYINMSKMKFKVNDEILADGVKLYDIQKIIPNDTYMWSGPENTQYAESKMGLENMLLEIRSLDYKGKHYDNARVNAMDIFTAFLQTTHFTPDTCTQRYKDFKVYPVKKAEINNEIDITEEFNNVVVPWLNKEMSTQDFRDLVDKYFDTACNAEGAIRLQQLITSPYSD